MGFSSADMSTFIAYIEGQDSFGHWAKSMVAIFNIPHSFTAWSLYVMAFFRAEKSPLISRSWTESRDCLWSWSSPQGDGKDNRCLSPTQRSADFSPEWSRISQATLGFTAMPLFSVALLLSLLGSVFSEDSEERIEYAGCSVLSFTK